MSVMKPGVLLCLLLAALLPCACHHTSFPPPGQPTLEVDGREILVEPSLVRNIMPGGPPGGGPMMLHVGLAAADSLRLPSGLNASRAWVVSGSKVWETDLARESGWAPIYKAEFLAYNGPKWGIGIYVDVTVRVDREGGTYWYIEVPDCLIVGAI